MAASLHQVILEDVLPGAMKVHAASQAANSPVARELISLREVQDVAELALDCSIVLQDIILTAEQGQAIGVVCQSVANYLGAGGIAQADSLITLSEVKILNGQVGAIKTEYRSCPAAGVKYHI